jgi:hypothetical protein
MTPGYVSNVEMKNIWTSVELASMAVPVKLAVKVGLLRTPLFLNS